jgi:hypothetical protein
MHNQCEQKTSYFMFHSCVNVCSIPLAEEHNMEIIWKKIEIGIMK